MSRALLFRRTADKSVRYFVQEVAELVVSGGLPERRMTLSVQDWEELRKDQAVELPPDATGLELACWIGEERFSVKPMLGQVRGTLSVT